MYLTQVWALLWLKFCEGFTVPDRLNIVFPKRIHFPTHCYSSQSSTEQHDMVSISFIDPVAPVPFPSVALHLLLKWKVQQRPQAWGRTGNQNQTCLDKDWRKNDEGNTDRGRKEWTIKNFEWDTWRWHLISWFKFILKAFSCHSHG